MIAKLTGIVSDITFPYVTIDVGGVGYGVYTTEKWKASVTIGQTQSLFIHTHVKEDSIELFGFSVSYERTLFELLLGVSGVGPRTALLIVSYGVYEVEQAISTANVEFF